MTAEDIEGRLDGVRDDRIVGWAWRPSRPGDSLMIEAVVDGVVIAESRAEQPRGDLAAAGKRFGACGFVIVPPPFLIPGSTVVVRVANGPELPGSPVTVQAPGPRRFPLMLDRADYRGVIEMFDEEGVRGWISGPLLSDPPLRLELWEGAVLIDEILADRWRTDLEPFRQGDGACGFEAALPRSICDGESHRLALRVAGGGPWLTPVAVVVTTPISPAAAVAPAAVAAERPAEVELSVIVVFYNMRREAERTLTSMTRAYQKSAGALNYEVVCIDNGSTPPLDAAFIEGFGPEFRLVRPAQPRPSPCSAINAAVREAKGRRLAVLIDGAHVLSPGVFEQAVAVMAERPDRVVAVRQWFIGGDQRWLSSCGYTRALEDTLFRKIDWPNDGYQLFAISTPMFDSPNHWLDGMNESNCLFLDAALYRRIGGFDEAFDEPGAGFANLDLFRRAADAAQGGVIALVGEASFHQYHGGTTTNVADHRKDALVEIYAEKYRALRGHPFQGLLPTELSVRGTILTDQALTARQHLMFPGGVSVTDAIRPVVFADTFEEEAQAYARTVYLETGQHRLTRWLGEPVDLAPADLLNIQEILRRQRPDGVVVIDDGQGLAGFVATTCAALAIGQSRILHVRRDHARQIQGVRAILGGPGDPSTLEAVREGLEGSTSILVLYEPEADDHMPIDNLAAWAELVSEGGWLVFLRTLVGQPWLGYSRNWRSAAARQLAAGGAFRIETEWQGQMITLCPDGYLRRVPSA